MDVARRVTLGGGRRVGETWCPPDLPGAAAEHARDPEVGDERAAVGGEQDVAGREVAVDEAEPVEVGEGPGQPDDEGDCLPGAESAAGTDELREAAPGGEVEHERARAVRALDDVAEPDDVRVVDTREERDFPGALCEVCAPADLDGDVLARRGVPGGPDGAVCPAAEEPPDDEARHERRPDGGHVVIHGPKTALDRHVGVPVIHRRR